MNVLVTGGAGFIGSSLVEALAEDGHAVRVLDDLSSGYADNVHPKAELLVGDVADEELALHATSDVDVVVNEAAHRAVLRYG